MKISQILEQKGFNDQEQEAFKGAYDIIVNACDQTYAKLTTLMSEDDAKIEISSILHDLQRKWDTF